MRTPGSLVYKLIGALPDSAVARLQSRASRSGSLSRVMRRLTRAARSGVHQIRGGPAAGLKIDLSDSRPSYILGTAEPEVTEFLTQNLPPGGVFFDVGANVGYFALVASRLVGPTGCVRAYEPLPDNTCALRRSVALNGLRNIVVIEAAASDTAGWSTFEEGPTGQDGRLGDGTLRVMTVVLDDDVAAGPAPTLIKLDVEGSEHDALRGLRRTLLEHRPIVLVEVHASSPALDTHPVPVLLTGLGYDVSWLEDGVEDGRFWAPHLVAVPRASGAQTSGYTSWS